MDKNKYSSDMNTRQKIEEILLNDFGSFDEYTVDKLLNLFSVSGIFMVEDRGKPLSFHQTKEGAEKAVKGWEESTIIGEWNIVPIKTLP